MSTLASGDNPPVASETPRGQTLAAALRECAAIMAPTCEPGENGGYAYPPGVSQFICDNFVRFGLWEEPLDHNVRRFARDFLEALGIIPGSCDQFAHVGDPSNAYDPTRQCARVAFLLFAADLAAEWGDDLAREIITESRA